MRKRILPIILVLIVLGIVSYFVVDYVKEKLVKNENIIEASGIIEATTVMLSSNSAGILTDAKSDEGQPVKKEQVVAAQDSKIIEKQIQVANANIEVVNTQIDAANLQYNQSIELAEEGVKESYIVKERMATYNHYIYYDQPISITKGESDSYSSSNSMMDTETQSSSQSNSDINTYSPSGDLVSSSENTTSGTSGGTSTAKTYMDTSGYSTSNSISYAGAAQKESVKMQLDEAINQYKMAALRLKQIKENNSQVSIAQKSLDVVKAQLELYKEQLDDLNIKSPIDGIILNKFAEAGEYLLPGTPVYEVGDLYNVECNIYIPEDQYGKIFMNQKVVLSVDSYPGEQFMGYVTKISDKAEFTPKNIQTKEDRVTTVYKITISIKNSDLKLKPGMPADVSIAIDSLS
jgi:HlyD family secretion protein